MAQAKWVNKSSIMKDLSLTQGKVKIDAGQTIGITDNEKPPAQLITEETEEQYFGDCLGDGVSCEPDYEAIKQYLTMVNNIGSFGDADEDRVEKVEDLELTKLPIVIPVAKKKGVNHSEISQNQAEMLTKGLKITSNKGRRNKNVAIASILKEYAGVPETTEAKLLTTEAKLLTTEEKLLTKEAKLMTTEAKPLTTEAKLLTTEAKLLTTEAKLLTTEAKLLTAEAKHMTPEVKPETSEIKLLKPADFIEQKVEKNSNVEIKPKISKESIKKVTMWIDGNGEKKSPVLFTKNMFRKKTTTLSPPSTPSTKDSSPKTVTKDEHVTPIPRVERYEPTAVADELYKKFKANSEQREAAEVGVWMCAQKEMKALDLKKKQEQERKDSEELARLADQIQREEERRMEVIVLETGVEITLPGAVCLPQHRHLLTGTCQVCEVLCVKEQATLPDEQ